MLVKKILAVRNDRFGEFLLTVPALRALNEAYPAAQLFLAVSPSVKELAHAIDCVDEVIELENKKYGWWGILKVARQLKKQNFNLCVIFNPTKALHLAAFFAGIPMRLGYDRKAGILLTHKIPDRKHLGLKHEIEYNLELLEPLGISGRDKDLSLSINSGIINNLWEGISLKNDESPIALHPWTSDSIKQWPLQNFQKLVRKLTQELRSSVIVIGGNEEVGKGKDYFSHIDGVVNLTGKTSLLELLAVLKRCTVLISGDSGPVHLASAAGVPVVALFRNDIIGKGPRRWGPVSKGSVVIEKPCLSDISIDEVFDQVRQVMKR